MQYCPRAYVNIKMNLFSRITAFLRNRKPLLLVMMSAAVIAAALSACSPKKNTAATRRYQAFITRYNVYFNGDEHFKETLKELENNYEDEYTSQLLMHPVEAYALPKATRPTGSFTRSIEKAQKAIQLRSIKKRPRRKPGKGNDPEYKAWLKREEYNPFLHNAWMLMGRSQYFNGDFAGAASTFYYVSKHFSWLPTTVTEAQLWTARSYCALDWLFEAETILRRIKPEELTSGKLKDQYYFTYADFYIRSHDYEKAIPMLREAIRYASRPQKIRLNFLLGQIYARTGQKELAYEAFGKAGGASAASYRTKFNARIKQSEVYTGSDIEPEVKALRRMTRYDRNKEYLDQIYYAIGNLYLSRGDTIRAIENYELAAKKSTRNGMDKAMSQLTLGGLYFDRHRYDLAQPCYSEAVPQLPETYPNYSELKRRSDVLDELAVYSQNVTLNDSLLRLSAMTPEQQLEVVNKIIDDLKKKEKEEADAARREEYLAQQEAMGSNLKDNSNAPNSFQLNADKSWYFYNTATRNAGRTDFQRRWGSRKLEDNWRRRNKATFSTSDFGENSGEEDEGENETDGENSEEETAQTDGGKEAENRETDPHYPEYYLKQIPKTDVERTTAGEVIQEGLYNMGIILKDKLEDFDAADSEFSRLMTDYPDNTYRLDVYNNLYLMNMRRNRPDLAERYRQLIISEFPDSKYASAMRDPHYLENLRAMPARQEELYARTYDDYLNNRNGAVHRAYNEMMEKYPLSKIMPKFMFLHALAYVTENRPDEFNATLKELLERYPDTDITPLASAYLKGMAQGRKLHSGPVNNRGMLWDIRLTNDSTALAGDPSQIEFTVTPDEPQLLVLLFSTDSIAPNQLLFEVARHNFSTFVVRDFDLELMNFGQLGLLIVKGFANQAELNHYRKLLAEDQSFSMPQAVRPVMISQSNFDKLLHGGGSFDDYFKFIGEETIRATHEEVLPPEEYPTAGEMFGTGEPADSTSVPEAAAEPAPDVPIAEEELAPDLDYDPTLEEDVPPLSPALPAKPDELTPPVKTAEPAKPATPAEPAKPTIPEFPEGSEGDDPLLEF